MMKRFTGICGFFILLFVLAVANCGATTGTNNKERQQVTPDQIRTLLEKYVQEQIPPGEKLTLQFKELYLPDAFSVPMGKMDMEILAADSDILDNRSFNVQIRVDGNTVKNLSIRCDLQASGTVPVAATGLKQGKILTADDVVLQEVDLTEVRAPVFTMDDVIGKRVRRSIRQGQPIEQTYIDDPPLVKRGETVTVVARRGAMELTAQGLARQDGTKGEMITVRNTNSRKDIVCRVSGPGLVEVEF